MENVHTLKKKSEPARVTDCCCWIFIKFDDFQFYLSIYILKYNDSRHSWLCTHILFLYLDNVHLNWSLYHTVYSFYQSFCLATKSKMIFIVSFCIFEFFELRSLYRTIVVIVLLKNGIGMWMIELDKIVIGFAYWRVFLLHKLFENRKSSTFFLHIFKCIFSTSCDSSWNGLFDILLSIVAIPFSQSHFQQIYKLHFDLLIEYSAI